MAAQNKQMRNILKILFGNIFLLLFSIPIYAHTDSLLSVANSNAHDTIRIHAYNMLANEALYSNFESGYAYAEMALDLSNAANLPLETAKTLEILGNYFLNQNNYSKVKYYLEQSAIANLSGDDYVAAAINYRDLSKMYMYEGNSDSCIICMLQAIEDFNKVNDSVEVAKCYIDLGGRLSHTGDYLNSIKYTFEGINSKAIEHDSLSLAIGFSNLSNIYFYLNKPYESLKHIRKATAIAKSIHSRKYPEMLINLGSSFYYLQDSLPAFKDSSIYCYEQALEFSDQISEETAFYLNNNLTLTYLDVHKLDRATKSLENCGIMARKLNTQYHNNTYQLLKSAFYLRTGNFQKTIDELQSFNAGSNIDHLKFYHENLHEAYYQAKDYKKSYFHIREFMLIKDSLQRAENFEALYSKEAEFKFQLKEQELLSQQEKERILLKSRIKIRLIIISGLLFVISLLLILGYFLYKSYQQKKKDNQLLFDQKQEIEDKQKLATTLLRELNHRVKNNLQMVSSLLTMQAYKLNNGEAQDAINDARLRIESLSLLHQHLYKSTENIDPDLSTYLNHLVNYIIDSSDIEYVKLDLHIDDVTVKTDMAIHIGLIVNELVTNAIKYGLNIDSKDNWIDLNILSTDKQIIIKISDSGKVSNNEVAQNSTSFGLKLIEILISEYDGLLHTDLENNGFVEIVMNRSDVD